LLNDLLEGKAGLDNFPNEVFKNAKRRLLNAKLLSKVKISHSFLELPLSVQDKVHSFVDLTVKICFYNYFF